MSCDRHGRVLAAAGIEPAARPEQRADKPAVPRDQCQKDSARHDARRSARVSAESRSRASSDDVASAAAGKARTTSRAPPGSAASRSRTTCRSCRLTRFRVTASPTARPTTKPARGSAPASSELGLCTSRWTMRRARPTRRPFRTAAAKSGRRRSRDGAGNTSESASDQADSAWRPLRRRAARMARPARVRMRSRKPCVFARRRLFGWNVRLLTGGLQGRSGSRSSAAG